MNLQTKHLVHNLVNSTRAAIRGGAEVFPMAFVSSMGDKQVASLDLSYLLKDEAERFIATAVRENHADFVMTLEPLVDRERVREGPLGISFVVETREGKFRANGLIRHQADQNQQVLDVGSFQREEADVLYIKG